MIGLPVPPVVIIIGFMLKSVVPELSLRDIFGGSAWFVAMFAVALAVLIAFPQLVLFLSNTMFQ